MTVATGTDLGRQLRTARLRLGLTQRDLAGRVNVSSNWISMLESGRRGITEEIGKRLVYHLELSGELADLVVTRSAGRRTLAPMAEPVRLRCRGVAQSELEAAGLTVQKWMPGHHASTCKVEWVGLASAADELRSRSGNTFVCMPCQSELGKLKGFEKVRASTGARSARSWADIYREYGHHMRTTAPSPDRLVRSRSGTAGLWVQTRRRLAAYWLRSGTEVSICRRCLKITFTRAYEKRIIGRTRLCHNVCRGVVAKPRSGRPVSPEVLNLHFNWAVRHLLRGESHVAIAKNDHYASEAAVRQAITSVVNRLPDPQTVAAPYRALVKGLQEALELSTTSRMG